MNIGIEEFKREVKKYDEFAVKIENVQNDPARLNNLLKNMLDTMGVKLSWNGDFDTFMQDKNSRLVFR